jgi:hypothetical protein
MLHADARGLFLQTDEGHHWRLDAGDGADGSAQLAGRMVTIEAWQRGASRLEPLWIGPLDGEPAAAAIPPAGCPAQ